MGVEGSVTVNDDVRHHLLIHHCDHRCCASRHYRSRRHWSASRHYRSRRCCAKSSTNGCRHRRCHWNGYPTRALIQSLSCAGSRHWCRVSPCCHRHGLWLCLHGQCRARRYRCDQELLPTCCDDRYGWLPSRCANRHDCHPRSGRYRSHDVRSHHSGVQDHANNRDHTIHSIRPSLYPR